METVLIIAADIAVLVGLFLIALYLAYDKYRFQIDRQFSSVSEGIGAALCLTPHSEAYSKVKNTWNKLGFLAEIYPISELEPFQVYFDVHNELAHKYNYKLSASVFRRILPFLGFKPYSVFEE